MAAWQCVTSQHVCPVSKITNMIRQLLVFSNKLFHGLYTSSGSKAVSCLSAKACNRVVESVTSVQYKLSEVSIFVLYSTCN